MTVALGLPPQGSLTKLSDRHDWVACGWFTDDTVYRPLAQKLAASLDKVGAPYDFVSVPKLAGGWEANTMAKPGHVLAAMTRHPDKTIIFLDVDMTALGDLAPLADIRGDIAFMILSRRRSNGTIKIGVNSQLLVIKPTPAASRFIKAWHNLGETDRYIGDNDQSTLAVAVGTVSNCGLVNIDRATMKALLLHETHKPGRHQMNGFLRETANMLRTATRVVMRRARG